LPLGRFPPPSQKAGVDARLDPVVLRAMEKQPEQRYQQMSDMKTAVEAAGQAPVPKPKAPAAEPAPLNGKLEALLTAGMLVLVGAFFGVEPFLPATTGKATFYGVLFWVVAFQLVFEPTNNRHVRRLCGLTILGWVVSYFVSAPAEQEGNEKFVYLLALGLPLGVFRVIQSFRPGGPVEEEEADESAEPIPGLTTQEEGLRRLLLSSADDLSDCLSVLPDIDNDLLRTARHCCRAAPEDRILAVLDFSGGEGTSALLFGCTGLYWRNGDDTSHPETGWLRYTELADRRVVNHGDVVYLGNDQFLCPNPDDSGIDCEALVSLLTRVRDALAPRPGGAEESGRRASAESAPR
jgi:hypothetical protein